MESIAFLELLPQLRNFNISCTMKKKPLNFFFYAILKECQEIRQMFNARIPSFFFHAVREHLIHFTPRLLCNLSKIAYGGKSRVSCQHIRQFNRVNRRAFQR